MGRTCRGGPGGRDLARGADHWRLQDWRGGNEAALHRLVPLVHRELRRIARGCLANERAGHTLQATALVSEAYIRLVDVRKVDWQNRAHFSPETVMRDWKLAKAWLLRELQRVG